MALRFDFETVISNKLFSSNLNVASVSIGCPLNIYQNCPPKPPGKPPNPVNMVRPIGAVAAGTIVR